MTVTIWHNPDCSTSRRVLAALQAAAVQPEVVLYLQTGWPPGVLDALLAQAGMTPEQALRRKEPLAAALGLLAPGVAAATLLQAMIAHPVLVERPFVRRGDTVVLCRPAERLQALIG